MNERSKIEWAPVYCPECRRELKSQKSRESGIGPVCKRKRDKRLAAMGAESK